MFEITLNPGFVPILVGLLVLAMPRGARAPAMMLAAATALWLLLDHEFGAGAAVAQMGLPVVLLNLDALNRIFGIALLLMLIVIAIYASGRRNRYEDAAILIMAGGAVSALFVGDLVSFVAAAALTGLASAWIVFASPLENAGAAGVRLLVWHGLEGLLLLVGVAFHLATGAENSMFARLDATTLGGAFIFAALMIRVGAPLAHVWLNDAVAHASAPGAAALCTFTSILGVYALARLFPAEPALILVGAGMMAVGVAYALAEDNLRAAGAYGLMAHIGIAVALIGAGSPLALAAAEGHAFAAIFAIGTWQMVLGGMLARHGRARASEAAGVSRAMPATAGLMIAAGLAASAAPGFALFASHAVALEASGQWQTRWVWLAIAATAAGLFVALALRPALAVFSPANKPPAAGDAPFPILLGGALGVFFCAAIGLAPNWLYGLMPANLTFQPYDADRLAPQLEMMGAAGAVYILLRAVGLTPKERAVRLLDVDAFYRGPVAAAGRWVGVVMLRLHGAWQTGEIRTARAIAGLLAGWARRCDRPYRVGQRAALHLLVVGAAMLAAAFGMYL